MVEPTSTGAGSVALYKLGAWGFVAVLASVLVMSMTAPSSKKELLSALISTLVFAVCGGAFAIKVFALEQLIHGDLIDAMQVCGVVFACGSPGWVLVRAIFRWTEARADLEIDDLIRSAKDDMKKVKSE